MTIPLSGDVAAILTAAKANTLYQLTKGNYSLTKSIRISAANVSVNLNGSSLSLIPPKGSYHQIAVSAPHFTIYNGTIAKATGFIVSTADSTLIQQITTLGTIGQFFLGEKGSTNTAISGCTIGETTTVSVYWTADNFSILNSSLAGSTNEYVLREEIVTPGLLPKNALISNVHATNHNSAKQAIGIRMGSAKIINSIIDGNIRIGQSTAPSIGANNPSVIIQNTQFINAAYAPLIQILAGSIVTIQDSSFTNDDKSASIAVQAGKMSKITLINNTLVPSPASLVLKTNRLWGVPPDAQVSESGTVVK